MNPIAPNNCGQLVWIRQRFSHSTYWSPHHPLITLYPIFVWGTEEGDGTQSRGGNKLYRSNRTTISASIQLTSRYTAESDVHLQNRINLSYESHANIDRSFSYWTTELRTISIPFPHLRKFCIPWNHLEYCPRCFVGLLEEHLDRERQMVRRRKAGLGNREQCHRASPAEQQVSILYWKTSRLLLYLFQRWYVVSLLEIVKSQGVLEVWKASMMKDGLPRGISAS